MKKLIMICVAATVLVAANPADAVITTYFGEDLGLGEGTKLGSWANSDAASADFQARLVGTGTESFEGFANGTAMNGQVLAFSGAGTATFSGSMSIYTQVSGTNGAGRYPTDGINYLEGSTGSFTINFSVEQAAFGFYGIDIGDFGGQVTLLKTNGITETYTIPHTVNGEGGSVLFFGIIAETSADVFRSIQISNSGAGIDYFGFDEMTIGTLEQVVAPSPVIPAPGALLLGSMGMGIVGWLRRRRML